MDDPKSLVTRAVDLIEYHRKSAPQLAVVQEYQNHYVIQGSMNKLIKASHILARFNLVLKPPKMKIDVIDKNTRKRRVYEVREMDYRSQSPNYPTLSSRKSMNSRKTGKSIE